MGKSIAFLNMKGGVGKTTMAINLAYYLSYQEKKRVLVIDLDPQYNATQYLVDIDTHQDYVSGEKPTVYNILFSNEIIYNSILDGIKKIKYEKELKLSDFIRHISSTDTLDLIPSTIHLVNQSHKTGCEYKLQNFITKYEKAYDYIFVDCPPTFSLFLTSGIISCNYFLIPVKPDPLSILGIPLLENIIEKYSTMYGKKIEPVGIIFTMVRDTNMMDRVRDGVKKKTAGKYYIFENYTRNSTVYSEATEKHVPLWKINHARRDGHTDDFNRITKEFIQILQ